MSKEEIMALLDEVTGGNYDKYLYQSIRVRDIQIPGWRDEKRIELMGSESLAGHSVLDLACSFGMFCRHAKACGANRVLGVDDGSWVPSGGERLMALNHALAEYAGLDIEFLLASLDSEAFYSGVGESDFTTVYCFAIMDYVRDRDRLWALIDSKAEVLYFDSNAGATRDEMQALLRAKTNFATIEYLGQSGDSDLRAAARPFFRCER